MFASPRNVEFLPPLLLPSPSKIPFTRVRPWLPSHEQTGELTEKNHRRCSSSQSKLPIRISLAWLANSLKLNFSGDFKSFWTLWGYFLSKPNLISTFFVQKKRTFFARFLRHHLTKFRVCASNIVNRTWYGGGDGDGGSGVFTQQREMCKHSAGKARWRRF